MSDALGGMEEFRRLASAVAAAGMGIVLDVVPNHMAACAQNRFWAEPSLRERFFDIDPVSGRHRRFFDIDSLAAVRQEREEVFDATMGFALTLVHEGLIDGLRVDHPDGLAAPGAYLQQLHDSGATHVWVEKILTPGEQLPDWPVTGTVGYEFLNDAAALFVDPAGEAALTRLWTDISGDSRAFAQVAAEAKLEQVTGTFRPELERLARTLTTAPTDTIHVLTPPETAARAAEPIGGLDALALALASLPVYRTYVDPGRGGVSDADRSAIKAAAMPPEIARRLLLEIPCPPEFVTRFQQTSPAVMAKGVEDTALYRYARLLALCDVGGDPSRFGIAPSRFHAANAQRAERFPKGLLTTMTHDAKRSADVRARICALASVPELTVAAWQRFTELTEPLRSGGAPDDVERYLIFQTLLGVWPISQERLEAYVQKALREAKRNTSWVARNEDWERRVGRFVAGLYEPSRFERPLAGFLRQIRELGVRSSLAQVALKLTSPGVPDIYQGDEVEYRALVDPDNRQPVNWRQHAGLLRRLLAGAEPRSATLKLNLTLRLLSLRARQPVLFNAGYEPLDAGTAAVAFLRGDGLLTVAEIPRRAVEGDRVLLGAPRGRWQNVLTGEERTFATVQPLVHVVGEHGVGVYQRL